MEMEEKRKKNRGFLKALLILLLIAAAIGAVALAVQSQREGGLRGLLKSLSGREGVREFFYDNADGGAFTALDGGMAVAGGSGLFVYDEAGELAWSRIFTWSSPAITGEGDYRAAFDVGGSLVIFFSKDGCIAEIATDQPVVSADVNDLGYLTVCTESEDYFGVVTVYNSLGKAIYRWSAGSARILSARVSGRTDLVVLTVGNGGSRLVAMPLDSEEQTGQYTYPGLLIDLVYTDAGIIAVGTDCALGLSRTLEERWRYDLNGRYLRGCALDSSGAVLALSGFQVGETWEAVALSSEGVELGRLTFSDGPGPMALKDGRLALCLDGHIEIYDTRFNLLERFECDSGVQKLIMREDGSVLAAGTFSAYVYGGEE